MRKEINLFPKDVKNCDFDAKTGEIAMMRNLVCSGGCLAPVGDTSNPSAATSEALAASLNGAEIRGYAPFGDSYAVATDSGLAYCRPTASGYEALWLNDLSISLRFGLRMAGRLNFPDRFSVPSSLSPSEQGGVGAVHPTTRFEVEDAKAVQTAILNALDEARAQQAESKGFFHSPFFVRYALRMTDGTYSFVSPPELMHAYCLPPRLEVASLTQSSTDPDQKLMALGATVPYFALECTPLTAVPAKWRSAVAAVDIFVSAQIPTHSASTANPVGIAKYADCIADAAALGEPIGNAPYAGNWADEDSDYVDCYLSPLERNSTVWCLKPNPSLRDAVASEQTYHLAASLPLAALATGNIITITPTSTAKKVLEDKATLEAASVVDFGSSACAIANINGRIAWAESDSNIINISAVGNMWKMEKTITVGNGKIIAIVTDMSSSSATSSTAYAFATDGIWRMQAAASGLSSPIKVCDDVVASSSIASTSYGVCYATSAGLWLLSAGKRTLLHEANASTAMRLPYSLQALGLRGDEGEIADFSAATLWASADGKFVILSNGNARMAYDLAARAISRIDDSGVCAVLTRPLRMGDGKATRIERFAAIGTGLAKCRMALMGSNDMRHWVGCASARGTSAAGLRGTPRRYHALCIAFEPSGECRLHGIAAEGE